MHQNGKSIVIWTFFFNMIFAFKINFCVEFSKNYCKNSNPSQDFFRKNDGNLITSIIEQMQLNLDGALSCTTIIADTSKDFMARGNIY